MDRTGPVGPDDGAPDPGPEPPDPGPGDPERRESEDVLRIVESLGVMLGEMGLPRMPARVVAYLLVSGTDHHTAGDLARGLRVSPAAISGAVRYLQQLGFIARGRDPGERRDHYRLRDDLWYELWASRLALLRRWEQVVADGADLLGPGHAGGARLRETQAFFAFVQGDLPALMERWHEHRRALLPDQEPGS